MRDTDDLPTDPERVESEQASRGEVDERQIKESADEESGGAEDARAADEPFDRLRAELRRLEQTEKGWRHRRPWRWLMGWRRKPGDDPRP